MRVTEAATATFARHETFHPRYGWFRKAYAAAAEDPEVFGDDLAPIRLGVGKNMVRSIRFWGLAAKIIVKDPHAANLRSPGVVPTRFGHALFRDDGWDPYMEDPGTLWLLHWMLMAPPSQLPVWWLALNEFRVVEFDNDAIDGAIKAQLDLLADWANPSPSSVAKDVAVFLRSYAPVERSGRTTIDDLLDCPLRELGLIGRSAATGKFRYTFGTKPTLPSEVCVFAMLDYAARTNSGSNTATLAQLASEPGGPGQVMKLGEADLELAARDVAERFEHIEVSTALGAPQLSWSGEPEEAAVPLLDAYYGAKADNFVAGPIGDGAADSESFDARSDVLRRSKAASRKHPVGSSQ